jgi:hypothetical protein
LILTADDGRQAFFFRAFSASAELSRKRGAAFITRNGELHRVEDRIFLFDEAIDCFVFGDYLYVIRKRAYRRIFDQLKPLLRRARRAARDLNTKLPIANFDELSRPAAPIPGWLTSCWRCEAATTSMTSRTRWSGR